MNHLPLCLLSMFIISSTVIADDNKVVDQQHLEFVKEPMKQMQLRKKKPIFQKHSTMSTLLFPNVVPNEYADDVDIPLKVELVESRKTNVPFDYYDLPVCPLQETAKTKRKSNLGQRLTGHLVQSTPFSEIKVKQDIGCTILCHISIQSKPLKFIRKLVKDQYRIQYVLDDLPILMVVDGYNYAVRGYPIGFHINSTQYYLYNHLRFTIYYNQDTTEDNVQITGFHVHPVSIAHSDPQDDWNTTTATSSLRTCNPQSKESVINTPDTYLPLKTGPAGEELSVVYSYEVEWKLSHVKWTDRWDIYLLETPDTNVHYFSIINSLMIALLISGIVAIIMIRVLKKDIAEYNSTQLEMVEETGWKLVHGDVFRPPKFGKIIISVLVGTGMQIGTSVFVTLSLLVLRLLDPMKKGQILSSILWVYVTSGSVAGYTSARLYQFFQGTHWKRLTVLTACSFPLILVSMFTALNVILSHYNAASAVSFSTILYLYGLWTGICIPLVCLGSYYGSKAQPLNPPTKTNQVARFIPKLPSTSSGGISWWLVHFPHASLFGGLLPFASICIELYFVLGALWLDQIYFIMSFIMVICCILTLSCSGISIVSTYLHLCYEDYHWWWKSFVSCASTAIYIWFYSIWFLARRMELVGWVPITVYLIYMSMICLAFGLYCGSIGLLSSFWFTFKIYSAVKVD